MSRYDYEYYSLSVNNLDAQTHDEKTHEPNTVFTEKRSEPIISKCEDYDFAIENFKIDLKTLAVFIPTIRVYNDEASLTVDIQNTTIYTIGIQYKASDFKTYIGFSRVIFEPQDQTISQPSFKNGGYPDYSSHYYDIYNYEYFIVLVNKCIISAINNLKATLAIYGVSSAFINNDVPFFTFDKQSGLINLQAPVTNYNNELDMILNIPLYRLFNSLPFIKQNIFSSIINEDGSQVEKNIGGYRLNLNNFGLTSLMNVRYPPQLNGTNGTVETEYMQIYQDYETWDSWSPVESIVLTSHTIPIKTSARSANHSYINGIETTSGSLNVFELEITDFKSGSYEGGVIYNPSEKRWLNLVEQANLYEISISVFYRSKLTGELVPIKLNSGGTFSLKMIFRKLMF